MLLPGKVAIITGAATGIGQNGAHVFALEGAKVVIADINDKNGEETAKGIREQGNEATFVHTDVTSVSNIECMVKTTVGTYGQLDIFWHNAGGILPGHIDLVEEADYDREMAIELKGAIFGTKFAIREMRKIGGGCILFTSSMLGQSFRNYRCRPSCRRWICSSLKHYDAVLQGLGAQGRLA